MTFIGALADLLQQLFGVRTSPLINAYGGSVGATVINIAPTNPRRVGLTICNNSLNNVWILPAPDVSATKGFLVDPSGGKVTLRYDQDFELMSNAWYAIAPAGASNVTVLENILT